MRTALGLRAHSGWAALVALGETRDTLELVLRELAARAVRAAKERITAQGHEVAACAVLVGDGMPEWSVGEILAVHFRMHKAEGELFRDALSRAAGACALRLVAIPEKRLEAHAQECLGATPAQLSRRVAELGRAAGPPWGKDQKQAALAAWAALHTPGCL